MEYERWFVFLNKGFGVMKITDSQGPGPYNANWSCHSSLSLLFPSYHSAPIPSLKEKKIV